MEVATDGGDPLIESAQRAEVDVVDDDALSFFGPANTDRLDSLLGRYRLAWQHVERLTGLVAGDLGGVVRYVVEKAGIGDADTVLEPSAGQGDLAAHLPRDRTTCVETSRFTARS